MNVEPIIIGGVRYEYAEVDGIRNSNDERLLGEIDYTHSRINIEQSISTEMKRTVILHEILHGILEQAGVRDDSEETLVNVLSYGLISVFRYNLPLIAFLQGHHNDDDLSNN